MLALKEGWTLRSAPTEGYLEVCGEGRVGAVRDRPYISRWPPYITPLNRSCEGLRYGAKARCPVPAHGAAAGLRRHAAPFPSEAPAPRVRETETALFQAAEASYHRQAYRQAYQQYANYLERYPQGSRAMDARVREAEISGLLGDWQGSLRRYQGILTRQPQPEVALKARYGIGRAYFKLGEYQQATQVLDNLTAAPDLPRSLWFSTQALMVEIALKQGQVPQAFARLRLAAQDLASGDPEWFEDLKTRLLEQATVSELDQLAALYRDNPLSAALLLRLARLAQDSGQAEEARKWVATLKERFPNSPEAAEAERLLAGSKVVVGCLLPLSGQLSNIGFRVQRGMELAAKRASVKLVFRDTGTDPETAADLTRELAQDESVLAILGPLSSAVAQSAANAAQAAAVPLIALSQKDGLTQTGNWIFQAFLTPRQQVRAVVRQALSMGIKRFAILYPDSSYGRAFSQNFQEEVTAGGVNWPPRPFTAPAPRSSPRPWPPWLRASSPRRKASRQPPPCSFPTTPPPWPPSPGDWPGPLSRASNCWAPIC